MILSSISNNTRTFYFLEGPRKFFRKKVDYRSVSALSTTRLFQHLLFFKLRRCYSCYGKASHVHEWQTFKINVEVCSTSENQLCIIQAVRKTAVKCLFETYVETAIAIRHNPAKICYMTNDNGYDNGCYITTDPIFDIWQQMLHKNW